MIPDYDTWLNEEWAYKPRRRGLGTEPWDAPTWGGVGLGEKEEWAGVWKGVARAVGAEPRCQADKVSESQLRRSGLGSSLEVQWLGLHTSNAGGTGSIPGQGTEIPRATRCSQKINNKQTSKEGQDWALTFEFGHSEVISDWVRAVLVERWEQKRKGGKELTISRTGDKPRSDVLHGSNCWHGCDGKGGFILFLNWSIVDVYSVSGIPVSFSDSFPLQVMTRYWI